MTLTRIHPRHVPLTEAQILKARYDEARQIKDAWDWRLRRAQYELRDAITHGGDTQASARNLAAVEINVADAAGELSVALNAWVQATTHQPGELPVHVITHPDMAKLIDRAADLFHDGASQTEVTRTTGLARETLRKYFPGHGWTQKDGGDFRALTKRAEAQIERRSA